MMNGGDGRKVCGRVVSAVTSADLVFPAGEGRLLGERVF